jgi:hypothetical protein
MLEAAPAILVRPTGRLHHAVEREACERNDLAHVCSS